MTSRVSFSKRTAIALALAVGQSILMSPFSALADGEIRIAGSTIFENKKHKRPALAAGFSEKKTF